MTVGRICMMQIMTMLMCLGVSAWYNEPLLPFALGAIAYLLTGLIFLCYGRNDTGRRIGRREGMLTVTMTWLVLSLLTVIPIIMSGATSSLGDALFESISGFTTTGTTIFTSVEHLPKGILFLRSLMQWLGGIGIVVFTVALLPLFGGGASLIFNAETTGITHDRFLPRISDVAQRLFVIYLVETSVLIVLLMLGSMTPFDAVCHALTCISTGGYSTRDLGVLHYNSPYVEYVLSAFMYLGSLNLALVYFLAKGKPMQLIKDEEFRWFSLFIFMAISLTTLWLSVQDIYANLEESFRRALFQVISLGSSTGFLTADISLWQPPFWMIALILMFINGCARSTSGGLKMSRFMILVKNLHNEFRKQLSPHMLTPVVINGRQVSVSVVHQVLAFCLLYTLLIVLGSVMVMLDGNTFESSIGISVGCMSNSGPGLGSYVYSVREAGDFTKMVLSFLMLAGRLEVFTVMGILSPYFWRK